MVYNIFDPGNQLAPFIRHIWVLDGEMEATSPVTEKVFPDGCMEMILNYGSPFRRIHFNGPSEIQPPSFIIGQIKQYIEVQPTGTTGIIGIRFQPDGLSAFTKIPAHELTGYSTPLADLFGNEIIQLEEKIRTAICCEDRVILIKNFLLKKLEGKRSYDYLVNDTIRKIIKDQGRVDMAGITSNLKVSERHFEKKFNAVVGMSPKLFSRIVRFQYSLKMLSDMSFTTLAGLAPECGYYDQAHFTKDFKEFTGVSPRGYFKIDKDHLSHLLLE